MSLDPFADLAEPKNDPFADLARGSGGPLQDVTRTSAWRYAGTPPPDLSGFASNRPSTNAVAPSSPFGPINFDDLGKNIGGAFSDFGSAVHDVGSAAENFENTRETRTPDAGSFFGALGGLGRSLLNVAGRTPVVGGILNGLGTAVSAPLGLPALASGSEAARQAYDEQQNSDSTPVWGGLTAPIRGLAAAEQARGEELSNSPELGNKVGGALYKFLPYVMPIPGAEAFSALRGAKESRPIGMADLRVRDVTELPAPPERPALPAGDTIPLGRAEPMPSSRGQFWNAPDKPIEGEFHEIPTEIPKAGDISTSDVPKEDSGGGTLTPGRPYSFADLEARAGAKPGEPLFAPGEKPMGLDALSRDISEDPIMAKVRANQDLTKLPDRAASDAADAAAGRVPTGGDVSTRAPITIADLTTKPAGDLYDQLAASLKAKGAADQIVPRDMPAPPSDYVARNPTLLARHNAGQEFLAAARKAVETGDWTAADAAAQKVADSGGKLERYFAQLRKEGIKAPTPSDVVAFKSKGSKLTLEDMKPIGGGADLTRADAEAIRQARREARFGKPAADSFDRMVGPAAPRANPNPGRYVPTGGQRPVGARTPGGLPPTYRPPLTFGSLGRGLAKGAEKTTDALRTVEIAGSPFHHMGRHTSPLAFAHPIAWLKGGGETAQTLFRSAAKTEASRQGMISDLKLRGGDASALSELHGSGPNRGEELGTPNFKSKLLTPITRAGDAFSMGINRARTEAIRGAWTDLPGVRKPTAADLKDIEDTVRIFTGKGFKLRDGAPDWQTMLAKVARIPLFTPQFLTARVRMLGETSLGLGEIAKGLVTRTPVSPQAIERVRLGVGHVAAVGAWLALMDHAGFKVDTDPNSTNFLRADLGPRNGATGAAAALAGHVGMGAVNESNGHVYLDLGGPEAPLIRAIVHTVQNFRTGAQDQGGHPKGIDPLVKFVGNQLVEPFNSINKFFTGQKVELGPQAAPMWVAGGAQAAGWNPPTIQDAAQRRSKKDTPADIEVGPTPAPTTRPTRTATPDAKPKPRK